MTPSSNPGRRAVVTGAAGFIGSTLVDRLVQDGWAVLGVDSFDTYYDRAPKQRNLARALDSPQFTLAEVDTRDLSALDEAFRSFQPDTVFDLAAREGFGHRSSTRRATSTSTCAGFRTRSRRQARHGSRVVFASSSSVYGDDAPRPFREDQPLGRPLSPYAATKVAGEALVHAHHAVTGLPVGIARFFTVYGPRQRPDLAIMTFANRILDGEPIELFDGGRGVRDFTFVDDVVDAFVRLGSAHADDLTVNVGSGRPVQTLAGRGGAGARAGPPGNPQPAARAARRCDGHACRHRSGSQRAWDGSRGLRSRTGSIASARGYGPNARTTRQLSQPTSRPSSCSRRRLCGRKCSTRRSRVRLSIWPA